MVDYLVVGLGLAGIAFCEQLEAHGKSFKVIDDGSQQASLVAGGLYNPVILKRFTLAWQSKEQLDIALPFYAKLEKKLGVQLDHKVSVYRRFASVEEQNLWYEAADKPGLDYFLSTQLIKNNNPKINAPFGFGEVKYTGRVDTRILLEKYGQYLASQGHYITESFDYDALTLSEDGIKYKAISAKHLVFSEGFGLKQNPYFNYLPLNGTKGELLTIKAPELQEKSVIKSSVFIIPLGNDTYRIGATYKWKDKTNTPTEASRQELLEKLATFMECSYSVDKHVAGVRPTVADRRPLVGQHPEHKQLYALNGFGSRGVLIAPYAAQQLYDCITKGTAVTPEMDIQRFAKKWH